MRDQRRVCAPSEIVQSSSSSTSDSATHLVVVLHHLSDVRRVLKNSVRSLHEVIQTRVSSQPLSKLYRKPLSHLNKRLGKSCHDVR
jgi:hypothetical protein